MRFIITFEDDGYELRYWNEITEEVGEVLIKSWTQKKFYEELKLKAIKITQKELRKSFNIINTEERPFVVLKSKEHSNIENLQNEVFIVDEDLTYGR